MARLAQCDLRSTGYHDHLGGLQSPRARDVFAPTPLDPAELFATGILESLSKGTTSEELLNRLTQQSDEILQSFAKRVESLILLFGQNDPGARAALEWLKDATQAVLDSRRPPGPAEVLIQEIFDMLAKGTSGQSLFDKLRTTPKDVLSGFIAQVHRISERKEAQADPESAKVFGMLIGFAELAMSE
jgi:hypothetical protein